MSDSALRYATDICAERPRYSVNVYLSGHGYIDDVLKKIKAYIKNKGAAMRMRTADEWMAEYENGSRICIVFVETNAIGRRCDLAIAGVDISATTIDTVVRPSEHNDHPLPTPAFHVQIGDTAVGTATAIGQAPNNIVTAIGSETLNINTAYTADITSAASYAPIHATYATTIDSHTVLEEELRRLRDIVDRHILEEGSH